MITHPIPKKNCCLTEACEWIAFGWEPVSQIYRQVDERFIDKNGYVDLEYSLNEKYLKAIRIASFKLLIALYEKQIAGLGVRFKTNDSPCFEKYCRVRVDDCSRIYFEYEQIICPKSEYSYKYVYLSFKDVKKCFPRDENGNPIIEETKQKKIGYNSLYMEIMNKVIDDLSITEKNQSSKKSIYYHVLAKYAKQYNLSNNTIQMIASLVLNPESRLGKAKK